MIHFLRHVNPYYKGIVILALSLVLAFTYYTFLNLTIFGLSFLLILLHARKLGPLLTYVFFTGIIALGLFFTGLNQGQGLETGLGLGSRLLAFSSLGYVFSQTTDSDEFVCALQKHTPLPRKFAYGLLCAFNLLPQIKKEYAQALLALEVRSGRRNLLSLKPIFSTLVNSVRWSEALAMAMASKGFSEDWEDSREKTSTPK